MTRIRPAALIASLCTSAALVLAACNGGGNASPDPSDGSPTGSNEPVSLLMPSGAFERFVTPLLEDFTATTGIRVDAIGMPAEDARSRQILDLSNGTGEFDLILLDGMPWVMQVVDHLEPLPDSIADSSEGYLQPMLDMFTIDDNRYASPLGVSIRPLIYRTDIFAEAGLEPPETYEELLSTAQALTGDGVYGFVGPYGRASSHVSIWILICYNMGLDDILDESGTAAAFNNEAGVAALEVMTELYQNGSMAVDSIELAHDGTLVAMQEGRAAMTVLPTSFFLNMNDPDASEYAGSFAIAPMPVAAGVTDPQSLATGWGYGLSTYSDNAENALALLEFLDEHTINPAADASIDQLVRPVSEAAFEHPGVSTIFPDGQAELLRESLLNAKTMPSSARWDEVQAALGEEFQRAYLGEITPQEAIENAESRANTILAD